jgi:hypothetical protein
METAALASRRVDQCVVSKERRNLEILINRKFLDSIPKSVV